MVTERQARYHTPITTVDELWHRVEAAGASVPVHTIQSLFDSIPREKGHVDPSRFASPDVGRNTANNYNGRRIVGCVHANPVRWRRQLKLRRSVEGDPHL
ncbi:hypothetical protein TNCV_1468681 [Trichonephila clavipes]|uniref:Uncharacterized protein n=1 Tax=Trichonephila clavipes TaxID=2585209 RepID=A0A8X6S4K3_TRICX|nr:hypothetical protein TNCV_1468681 [Trichonephila clavipes]